MSSAKVKTCISANKYHWFGWLLAFLIVAVIAGQTTNNTGSDPRGTLLVSQAIVQHGTVKLDAYAGPYLDTFAHQMHRKNGRRLQELSATRLLN